ncbi:MAG: T9SS sorting signal type C domain-containing protein [Flavobacterium sp.]
MRTILLFFIVLFSSFGLSAQNVGDFRTKAAGPAAWNNAASWEVFNGTAWVNATNYPGQIAGSYNVLVQGGHTIQNPNTPNNFGAVTVTGIISLTQPNGVYYLNASSVHVTQNFGYIEFVSNADLRLPTGSSITVFPGGLAQNNPCSASKRIWIGSIVFSTCNGNGPGDPIPFAELMLANGSLLSVITSTFPNCLGITSASLIPSFIGLAGVNTSFQWEITAPNNSVSTSSANPLNLNLDQNGDYTIKLTYSTTYSNIVYTNTRTIVYNNKVTTWNGTTWSNGVPDINTRVIITGNYNGPSFSACSLNVTSSGILLIPSNQYVEVSGIVVNNGILTVENNGTLIQIQDVTNVGNITYKRRSDSVHRFDYVYWSSPVSNFNIANITGTSSRFFWNPVNPNGNGTQGNWVQYTNGSMERARGYIVRAPNTLPTQVQNPAGESITTQFFGVPHNGTINFPVSRGNIVPGVNDNYNLVGNPYPSALNIEDFLYENADANNIIEGAVRLWTHGSAPVLGGQNPFYGNFVYNYDANNYAIINYTGGTPGPGVQTEIGAGQGFFVIMKDGPAATQNIVFNNTMRRKEGNHVFFRTVAQSTIEKHRIWLDVVDANMGMSRTLIGYIEGATNDKDALYDATHVVETASLNLYTHVDQHDLCIQGRAFPFNQDDTVSIGVNVPQTGSYSFAIGDVDGMFGNPDQAIYIQDLELGIVHNLRQSQYEFTATQGNHKNRFVLRYTNETLSLNPAQGINNGVVVTNQLDNININSSQEPIHSVVVYNLLGQKVASYNHVGSNEINISQENMKNQVGVVSITLENGQVVNKKTAF